MQDKKRSIKDYSELNLILKDNFLEKKCFKELHKSIVFKNWNPIENYYLATGKHIWFSCLVENNLEKLLKNKVEKKFNVKIKRLVTPFTYTMLSNVKESTCHADNNDENNLGKDFNAQFIFYVNGNNELTNGTGFYTKGKNEEYHLTTHIGFVENRALLFKNNVMHSPLKFLSNDNKSRFSIICFLAIE